MITNQGGIDKSSLYGTWSCNMSENVIKNHTIINDDISTHSSDIRKYLIQASVNVKFGSQFSGSISLQTLPNICPMIILPYNILDEDFSWENGHLVYQRGTRKIQLPQNAYVVYFQNDSKSKQTKFFKLDKGSIVQTDCFPALLLYAQSEIVGTIDQTLWLDKIIEMKTNYHVKRLHDSKILEYFTIFEEDYSLKSEEAFNCVLSPPASLQSVIEKGSKQKHSDYLWHKTADNKDGASGYLVLKGVALREFITKTQKTTLAAKPPTKDEGTEIYRERLIPAASPPLAISKKSVNRNVEQDTAIQQYQTLKNRMSQEGSDTILHNRSNNAIEISDRMHTAIALEKNADQIWLRTNQNLHLNMNPNEISLLGNEKIIYLSPKTFPEIVSIQKYEQSNDKRNNARKGTILLNSKNNTVTHYFKKSQIYASDITLSYPHGDTQKLAKVNYAFGQDKIYPSHGKGYDNVPLEQVLYLEVDHPTGLNFQRVVPSPNDLFNMDDPHYAVQHKITAKPPRGYVNRLITEPKNSSIRVYKLSSKTRLIFRVSVPSLDIAKQLMKKNDNIVGYKVLKTNHMDPNLKLAVTRHHARVTKALGENPYKNRIFVELTLKPL